MASGKRYESPAAVPFTVKVKDMDDEKLAFLEQLARDLAFKGHTTEKDAAGKIRQAVDKKFGGSWHVIVGRDYGCRVTHAPGNLCFFYVGSEAVMLFKVAA